MLYGNRAANFSQELNLKHLDSFWTVIRILNKVKDGAAGWAALGSASPQNRGNSLQESKCSGLFYRARRSLARIPVGRPRPASQNSGLRPRCRLRFVTRVLSFR